MSILPQFHCYGLMMAFVCLHTATPNVVFSRYHLEHVLEAIQKYRATFMFCVPPIVLALTTAPEVDKYDLSTLESVASGASALSSQLRTAQGTAQYLGHKWVRHDRDDPDRGDADAR